MVIVKRKGNADLEQEEAQREKVVAERWESDGGKSWEADGGKSWEAEGGKSWEVEREKRGEVDEVKLREEVVY